MVPAQAEDLDRIKAFQESRDTNKNGKDPMEEVFCYYNIVRSDECMEEHYLSDTHNRTRKAERGVSVFTSGFSSPSLRSET
jgi:hypothetical protein